MQMCLSVPGSHWLQDINSSLYLNTYIDIALQKVCKSESLKLYKRARAGEMGGQFRWPESRLISRVQGIPAFRIKEG